MSSSPNASPDSAAANAALHAGTRAEGTAYALLVMTTFFWGANFIVAKWVSNDIGPFGFAFWRWTVALSVLLPFVWARVWAARRELLAHWKLLWLMGACSCGLNSAFAFLAVQHTNIVNVAILNSLGPIMTMVAAVWLAGEWLNRGRVIGAALSVLGAMVIATKGDWGQLVRLQFNKGDIYMILACAVWAVYTGLLKRAHLKLDPLASLAVMMLGGLLLLGPLYFYETFFTAYGARGVNVGGKLIAAVFYTGIFASLISNICWQHAIKVLGAARTSVFGHLIPVFGIILAVLLLGERLYAYHAIGAALIIAGIVQVNRHATPAPAG